MNAPDRMDALRLPEGMAKITITPDEKIVNAALFVVAREDHTVGNLLRMCVVACALAGPPSRRRLLGCCVLVAAASAAADAPLPFFRAPSQGAAARPAREIFWVQAPAPAGQ